MQLLIISLIFIIFIIFFCCIYLFLRLERLQHKEKNVFSDVENIKQEVEKIFGEKKDSFCKPGEARFILMQRKKGE